jgi:hypothetical protein
VEETMSLDYSYILNKYFDGHYSKLNHEIVKSEIELKNKDQQFKELVTNLLAHFSDVAEVSALTGLSIDELKKMNK